MNTYLTLLGLFWIALGLYAIIFTKAAKKYYGVFIRGNHPKSMGALAILAGGLLISASGYSKVFITVFVLGFIQVIKGLYLIFMPAGQVKALINWWLVASLTIYRIWAIVTLIMGMALLHARL